MVCGGFCGWVHFQASFLVASRETTHTKGLDNPVKVAWRYKLDLSAFNAMCECSQQWGPAVRFFRERPSLLSSAWSFRDIQSNLLANNLINCKPIPPLESLPDYKIWSVQTLHPPLLGALTSIDLTDSRKFSLY